MFKTIKDQVDLLETIERYEERGFKQVGDSTMAMEDEVCPFCGHRECFRIKTSEKFFKCFSCDVNGDVSNFVALKENIKPVDAARLLAKHHGIDLPSSYNPIQEILELAAYYYHICLVETYVDKKYPELNDMTPIEYQTVHRGHSHDVVYEAMIGWSDGGVIEYLKGIGYDETLLEQSGLMGTKGRDYLARNVFVYPHFVSGKVSHFTQKDPLKKAAWQFKNKHSLNNYMFYNQDSIVGNTRVIVVEGENDLLSVLGVGWTEGVIATIGQISVAQLDWIAKNLADKEVITIFDVDEAGDKYREKVGKLGHKIKEIAHIMLPEEDVDFAIKKQGMTLEQVFSYIQSTSVNVTTNDGLVVPVAEMQALHNIVEKGGCYYKVTYKEGEPVMTLISDFTVRLKNVFIQGLARTREVVIIRRDGRVSKPFVVTSEDKVSVKSFKTLAANAIDATFYGNESSLPDMWNYIYEKGGEREVLMPHVIGRSSDLLGWVFSNCFISDSGSLISPDTDGTMWIPGTSSGVKPSDLNVDSEVGGSNNSSIPYLNTDMDVAEREEFEAQLVNYFCMNIGDVGMALTMLAWMRANAFSDTIHARAKSFPFLYLWGRNGKGKSVIGRWLLGLYGMEDKGYSVVSQLRSGIGFSRKLAYYGSLPLCIDEMRQDQESRQLYPHFRGWYNRAPRDMGTRDSFGIKVQRPVSTIMLMGEDMMDDTAAKQRCISFRIPSQGRELDVSYNFIKNNEDKLSSLGLHWILQSSRTDPNDVVMEHDELLECLKDVNVDIRIKYNWAAVMPSLKYFCNKYFPDFDYVKYVAEQASIIQKDTSSNDMVAKLFQHIEQLQVGNNPKITGDHISKEGNSLFIWFAAVCDIVAKEYHNSSGSDFSKDAILSSIRDEPWFVAQGRKTIGITPVQRRCIEIRLDIAPEVVKNVAGFYD